ncbi:MAG TPA: DUF2231 domain-containing protein [Pilimelia sp.]|nr:DUF2231 domain-containing protein [Pilimelia sp.]
MFDEFMGLPLHPLVVHAAVVFVPLLCLLAVAYALVPRVRVFVGWAAAALAVIAPVVAWVATRSGLALEQKLISQGFSGDILTKISEHRQFGERTFYVSIPLGLVTLALVLLTGTRAGRARTIPGWASVVLAAAVVVLAAVTAYYVFRTGDSGARAVWETS